MFNKQNKEDIERIRLYDGLINWMEKLVKDLNKEIDSPEKIKEIILCRFTEFLGRTLMQAPIHVKWQDFQDSIYTSLETLGMAATIVDGKDFNIPSASEKSNDFELLNHRTFNTEKGWSGIEISFSEQHNVKNVLCILIEGEPQRGWESLFEKSENLKSIVISLNALMSIQDEKSKIRKIENIAYKIDRLVKGSRPIAIQNILDAIQIILEISQVDWSTDIYYKTEIICVWLLQEIFSYGWTVRLAKSSLILVDVEISGEDGYDDSNLQPLSILSLLATQVENTIVKLSQFIKEPVAENTDKKDCEVDRLRWRLKALKGCFLASQENPRPMEKPVIEIETALNNREVKFEDIPLFLLATWSHIHSRLRSRKEINSEKAGSDDFNQEWDMALTQTKTYLTEYLASTSWHSENQESDYPVLVRNWLQLWFFLQVLLYPEKTNILQDDLNFVRTELAYGLRESLRFACFGDRLDYDYHYPTFVNSMRVVIDFHAHWIVGLPREFNIRDLLENIGNTSYQNGRRTPKERLQHVINVYLIGHFFLSLHIDTGSDSNDKSGKPPRKKPMTIAHKLASNTPDSRPGEETVKVLKKTFTLAALFHDIGHVFFPISPDIHFGFYRGESTIKRSLDEIEKILRQQGGEIVKRYIQTLEEANYFSAKKDEFMGRWLEPQKESGKPDHGLLGAWYLHQASTMAPGYSKDIIKSSVRAVLLHNALTVPIDSDSDPVASLLTLCHELSEWEDLCYIALPNAKTPSSHIWTSVSRSNVPGTKWLDFRHLNFSIKEKELYGAIKIPDDKNSNDWPTIVLELQSLEQLEHPTFICWLLKSQNIGRIKNSNKKGWVPKIIIKGDIPEFLVNRGLTSEKLLIQLARKSKLPFRTAISSWLTDGKPFDGLEKEKRSDQQECILIKSLPDIDFRENLYNWISQMKQEAINLTSSQEADGFSI